MNATFTNRKSASALMSEQGTRINFFDTQSKDPEKMYYPGTTTKRVFFACGAIQGHCSKELAQELQAGTEPYMDYCEGHTETGDTFHVLMRGQKPADYKFSI